MPINELPPTGLSAMDTAILSANADSAIVASIPFGPGSPYHYGTGTSSTPMWTSPAETERADKAEEKNAELEKENLKLEKKLRRTKKELRDVELQYAAMKAQVDLRDEELDELRNEVQNLKSKTPALKPPVPSLAKGGIISGSGPVYISIDPSTSPTADISSWKRMNGILGKTYTSD